MDCFTHTGSFALNAGLAGAGQVTGVDASQLAVDQATENAVLNGLSDRVSFLCADVFDLLPKLEKDGERYDVVILDPPAFTKSRSSIKQAVKGYREINLRGLKPQAPAPGGVPHPGRGSSDFVGRGGILLSEILHFPGLRRKIGIGRQRSARKVKRILPLSGIV